MLPDIIFLKKVIHLVTIVFVKINRNNFFEKDLKIKKNCQSFNLVN